MSAVLSPAAAAHASLPGAASGLGSGYERRRGELEAYFDRTAAAAWARLTSEVPVGRIRASVRAGRERMRDTLLSWLPDDLRGARVLDAGCGTGALSVALAGRGADVLAIDLSPTLLDLARERLPPGLPGRVTFRPGDMLAEGRGRRFDHVVAMDSLIHYRAPDMVAALSVLVGQAECSVLSTFAPRTPLLAVMHAAGRLFPRGQRAPAIEPLRAASLFDRLDVEPSLDGWHRVRSLRVGGGFYTSQAFELVRR